MEYWRKILTQIVSVIKFLGSRGIAFRGADQKLGSIHKSNFLGTLELLSEFDPLIASHIAQYGNKGRGKISLSNRLSELKLSHCALKISPGRASYLSNTICDEFISLIGEKVLSVILDELRDA